MTIRGRKHWQIYLGVRSPHSSGWQTSQGAKTQDFRLARRGKPIRRASAHSAGQSWRGGAWDLQPAPGRCGSSGGNPRALSCHAHFSRRKTRARTNRNQPKPRYWICGCRLHRWGKSRRSAATIRRGFDDQTGTIRPRFPGQTLAGVSTTDLETWLRGLEVGAVSRNSYRRRLVALFGYGVDRGWCPGNPALKVAVAKEDPAAIGILSPDRICPTAGGRERIHIAVLGDRRFCRHSISRTGTTDMERRSLGFRTDRDFGRQRENRGPTLRPYATRPESLARALPQPSRADLPRNRTETAKLLVADRTRAGLLKWPNNALRHSFRLLSPGALPISRGNSTRTRPLKLKPDFQALS